MHSIREGDWKSNWPKGFLVENFFSVMRQQDGGRHPFFVPLLNIVNLDTHFVPLLNIECEWKVITLKSETFTIKLFSPAITIAIAVIF